MIYICRVYEDLCDMNQIKANAAEVKPVSYTHLYKDGVAYDSFEDPELRYRQRYVDLVVNEGIKETFEKLSLIHI